ncbi:hypothetical protein BX285_7103 [Streptomyces sp. 1114.5]|uniref:DUF6458 family protein n=1 Tax=unclassified Streptomyces TaxID=2593676 RepID=UPI000BC60A2E|nr:MULTISPECIES: DUF6458 family protein [unclassified Streptomyces]RKT08737.1 hypothetical protein BX285_7103 [Streptomyces sp. 1114.5]SOB78953.1 hypothetical protein SAMN06272789_0180 [Streptomyces sp. 1331.2]
MGIGGCIGLFALGAVMAFATDWHLKGINVHMVGWILMAAGLLGMITYVNVFRRRRMGRRVDADEVVEERRYYE